MLIFQNYDGSATGLFIRGNSSGYISPSWSGPYYNALDVVPSTSAGSYYVRLYGTGDDNQTLYDEAEVVFEWIPYDSFSLSCGNQVELTVGVDFSLEVQIDYQPSHANIDDLRFTGGGDVVFVNYSGGANFNLTVGNPGNDTIIIYNDNYPGWSESINVTVNPPQLESVTLSEDTINMRTYESYNINIMDDLPWETLQNLRWDVQDSSIAEISGNGSNWTVNSYSAGSTEFYLYEINDPSTTLATLTVNVEEQY